jgi:hypothetical protein
MGGDMNERESLGEERKEFLEKQFEEQLERNREFMLQYGEEQIRFNREEYDREKQKMLDLQLLWNSGYQGRLKVAKGFFSDLMTITQNRSKTLFKISKGVAIADALVSTYQGAAKALKLPFPSNLAAMSSTLAAGFAQVNAMKSVDVGSGGGGGGGVAATTATAEAPAQIMETNVTFSSSGDISQDQFRGFVNGLNDALDDGMTIGRITA